MVIKSLGACIRDPGAEVAQDLVEPLLQSPSQGLDLFDLGLRHLINHQEQRLPCLRVPTTPVELMKRFFVSVNFSELWVVIEPSPEGRPLEEAELKSASK